jgi:hypothetical protein
VPSHVTHQAIARRFGTLTTVGRIAEPFLGDATKANPLKGGDAKQTGLPRATNIACHAGRAAERTLEGDSCD